MATDYTLPKDGEHVISFAYPSSDVARRLGQSERGCFVVRLVNETYAHATYSACVAHVEPLGTRPGRWSMDHPWNQHLYPHHDDRPEARAWHRRDLGVVMADTNNGSALDRQRQDEIDGHVLQAIRYSIEARIHDLDGQPAAAAYASRDAAAHVRCATFLASLRR